MLFLVFYFILFAILIFQGTHMAGEVKTPLGTVPEEVGQTPVASVRWGIVLIGLGLLGTLLGLASFSWTGLAALRHPLFYLGLATLAVFAFWVVFLGRRPEFMGKPTVMDGHGHH